LPSIVDVFIVSIYLGPCLFKNHAPVVTIGGLSVHDKVIIIVGYVVINDNDGRNTSDIELDNLDTSFVEVLG